MSYVIRFIHHLNDGDMEGICGVFGPEPTIFNSRALAEAYAKTLDDESGRYTFYVVERDTQGNADAKSQ